MNCLQMGNQETIIKRSKKNVAEGNTLKLDQAQAEPMGSLIIEAPTNHSTPWPVSYSPPASHQTRVEHRANNSRKR